MIDETFTDQDFEDKEILNYAPEEFKQINIKGIKQSDIIEAIKLCLKVSPLIKPSKTLVNSVYAILSSLYIDDKNYVIIEAPTGSGKTIIGFIVFFCTQYLYYKCEYKILELSAKPEPLKQLSYFLTSAKMLQEQIDTDLDRFDFRKYMSMLKGVDNYACIDATEALNRNNKNKGFTSSDEIVRYSERSCLGCDKKTRQSIFAHCDNICPYQSARYEASEKAFTIFNYAYFLNVLKGEFNPFFAKRFLTIADEAHLIPDIICNIFNYEFSQYLVNRTLKLLNEIEFVYGNEYITSLKDLLMPCFKVFSKELNVVSDIVVYIAKLMIFEKEFSSIEKIEPEIFKTFKKQILKINESIKNVTITYDDFNELINVRSEDVFFESEQIAYDKVTDSRVFKHIVKDLNESEMVKKHFLSKTNKVLFMSATLGDIDEYANMMGMEPEQYSGLRLGSTFDFEKSPIFLCKSGWLNYNNFDKNIDKVLMDTLKICETYHAKEKGIIHTSTFKICELLKAKINTGLVANPNRYLFYKSADEKEKCVQLMGSSMLPFVIIGPSLYEGLDLKDEKGRFNIFMKVPYAGINSYVRKKMERFPYWYKRNTVQKIVQGIGRTNRSINDYSTVYLMDSLFDKIIYETNSEICDRIVYKTIY